MKRRASVFVVFLIIFVGLFLGWLVGNFLTTNTYENYLKKLPASPLILGAVYDSANHKISLSLYNPGKLPITILKEAFIFKAGANSKQPNYAIGDIDVNITLPPLMVTVVDIKLKKGTEKLHAGDVVTTTLSYKIPLSDDIYTVIHPFVYNLDKKAKAPKVDDKIKKQTTNKK